MIGSSGYIFWQVVGGDGWWGVLMGSGDIFGWWWAVVGGGGYIWLVVGGGGWWWMVVGRGGWWWMVVGRGGWWHSLARPISYSRKKNIKYLYLFR